MPFPSDSLLSVPKYAIRAGARKRIYFDPKETRMAIVTAGAICPGQNDIIRAIVTKVRLLCVGGGLGLTGRLFFMAGCPGGARSTGHRVPSSALPTLTFTATTRRSLPLPQPPLKRKSRRTFSRRRPLTTACPRVTSWAFAMASAASPIAPAAPWC